MMDEHAILLVFGGSCGCGVMWSVEVTTCAVLRFSFFFFLGLACDVALGSAPCAPARAADFLYFVFSYFLPLLPHDLYLVPRNVPRLGEGPRTARTSYLVHVGRR